MTFKPFARAGLLTLLMLAGVCSLAQEARGARAYLNNANTGNGADNPDWTEDLAPPPPAFSNAHLLALDMPNFITTKVSVDPDTIVVGSDGVVRYVIVMVNASGNTTAVYEGIRCITDEVKTYARFSSSGTWNAVSAPVWKPLNGSGPSPHAFAFARQGGCVNHLATNKQEIVGVLKSGRIPSQSSNLN